MSRSNFPDSLLPSRQNSEGAGLPLGDLCNMAAGLARSLAEQTLNREVYEAAQLVSSEALTLMADVLRDTERVNDREYEQIKANLASRIHGTRLNADDEEIARHAEAIAGALVRAWLTHIGDAGAAGQYKPADVLPSKVDEGSWTEVWDTVSSYGVTPLEARRLLRDVCQRLTERSGDILELPGNVRLSRAVLVAAIDLSATSTFRREAEPV